MDIGLDISFALPAILFTVLAVILANTIFGKKAENAESVNDGAGERQNKDLDHEVDEVKEFAAVQQKEGEGRTHEANIAKENKGKRGDHVEKKPGSMPVAAIVEEIGVAEKQTATESVTTSTPTCQVIEKVDVEGPAPAPALVKLIVPGLETTQETSPPEPIGETAALAQEKAGPEPCSERKPGPVPEQGAPARTPVVKVTESSPVEEEHTDAMADDVEEEDPILRDVPGKLRTSQLEMMMTKEELEEEQRAEEVQCEQLAAIFKLLQENQETFGRVTEGEMEEQLKLYSI